MGAPDVAVALPPVDVVVVHFNAAEVLAECLDPVVEVLEAGAPVTLTVLDNDTEHPASTAEERLEPLDRASYRLRERNDGFGVASNEGAAGGTAPFVLFLNPDCVLAGDGIAALARRLLEDDSLMAIGPHIERPDGTPEISWAPHPGFVWEMRRRRLWKALEAGKGWALERARELTSRPRDVDWLTAACLMVRRSPFEAVGGFDEDYFLYFEDADLGVRLGRRGRLRFDPAIRAVHRGGVSAEDGREGTLRHYRASQRLYYQRHRPRWEQLALDLWRRFAS